MSKFYRTFIGVMNFDSIVIEKNHDLWNPSIKI